MDAPTPRWEVVYLYTTPDYSRRRGFDIVRRYRAVFVVQIISEEHARAEAKILFREAALRSSVSWARVSSSLSRAGGSARGKTPADAIAQLLYLTLTTSRGASPRHEGLETWDGWPRDIREIFVEPEVAHTRAEVSLSRHDDPRSDEG